MQLKPSAQIQLPWDPLSLLWMLALFILSVSGLKPVSQALLSLPRAGNSLVCLVKLRTVVFRVASNWPVALLANFSAC